MRHERDYYAEIDRAIKDHETFKPVPEKTTDWICNRIAWCWKFKKITEEQMDELTARITAVLGGTATETEEAAETVDAAKIVTEEPVNEETETEEEWPGLTVSLPRETFTDKALENLQALISARGELMKRAFQIDDLPLKITDEKVSFPWFNPTGPDEANAYLSFIQYIGNMAIRQKRISSKAKEIINEKYEFRCFLLHLGMIGDDYKQARKILLRNLSGSAAFRNGAKKGGDQA